MPEEDLLSHFEESNAFIADCLAKEGAVLIHCYRGRSRSATVMVAFLMQKHGYSAERALAKVRNRREIIQPHDSFLAQLKLFENMDFTIDPGNLQFKMFRYNKIEFYFWGIFGTLLFLGFTWRPKECERPKFCFGIFWTRSLIRILPEVYPDPLLLR